MRDTLKLAKHIVLLHGIIAGIHGLSHVYSSVYLPWWGSLFVLIVIVLAPLVSIRLFNIRYYQMGMWLLMLSMLGAFIFGVMNHFIVINPDHVSEVHEGNAFFTITSWAVALSELAGTGIGIGGLRNIGYGSPRSI